MAVQQVRIEVRLPEGHWAGDVTRSHPSAVLRIEEHMPLQKGRGTARASCSEEIVETVSLHPGIEEVRSFGKQSFVVDIIAGGGGFLKPLLKVGVIPQTPFEVRDGWVNGPSRALGKRFEIYFLDLIRKTFLIVWFPHVDCQVVFLHLVNDLYLIRPCKKDSTMFPEELLSLN